MKSLFNSSVSSITPMGGKTLGGPAYVTPETEQAAIGGKTLSPSRWIQPAGIQVAPIVPIQPMQTEAPAAIEPIQDQITSQFSAQEIVEPTQNGKMLDQATAYQMTEQSTTQGKTLNIPTYEVPIYQPANFTTPRKVLDAKIATNKKKVNRHKYLRRK